MSSLPVGENPLLRGPDATFITDEEILVINHHLADATAICYRLLQVLGMPYSVSNAAQLREYYQTLRDSATPETCPQLELVRVACYQLLQALGSPYDVSDAAPLGEHHVLRDPSTFETCPQLEFVWGSYHRLRRVYSSLLWAIQLGEHQVHQVLAIFGMIPHVMEQVTSWRFAETHLGNVLATCCQLLQVLYGDEYSATRLGEHQMLPSQIQSPASETAQSTYPQEIGAPVGGDMSDQLHCLYEGCRATFQRPQEHKRHLIDVHTPRRRCPCCPYEWCRPDIIKAHIEANHQDELSQEVLNEIRARRGRRLVAFLDAAL